MENGAPGRRSCTADFKIAVIDRWLRQHGASEQEPATVGIGISVDEIYRANRRRCGAHEKIEYPLLDLGLRRSDCERIIAKAGLPVPPKSSCYFCPFRTIKAWRHQREHEPDLFWRSVELERMLIARRTVLGKDPVYLSRYGRPLDEAISEPTSMERAAVEVEDGECDSGWCMT
jgi:uncharacterized protein YjiS (DUF1127 family)